MKDIIKTLLIWSGLYYRISFFYKEHRRRFAIQKTFYSQLMSNTDIVFDIGANIGQRSEIFRRLAKYVVAVEPQPFCTRQLESRFRFTRNVFIKNVAVDFCEKKSIMFISSSHTLSSMSVKYIDAVKNTFKGETWDKKLEIQTVTLDNLISLHGIPSFIKIDVEGFELNVLRGLTMPVKAISLEFSPMAIDELKNCVLELSRISSSYRYNYTLGEDLHFELLKHQSFDEFFGVTIDKTLAISKNFGDVYAILDK